MYIRTGGDLGRLTTSYLYDSSINGIGQISETGLWDPWDLQQIAEPQIAKGTSVPAFLTGLSGLGQSSTVKLSNGHFGLAMSHISIPDAAIRLLRRSATFKQMAATLDGAYVDHRHWTKVSSSSNARLNNAFRVVGGGNLNGRRVLYVGFDPAGSLFITGQSIESSNGWDIIRFSDALGQSHTIPWVRAIAHETAHAFARVTASGVAPKTPVDRVGADVRDECNARTVEHRVIAEIRNTAAGKRALATHRVQPPVLPCDCQRDWFPTLQMRSYLEHFVLGADWEAAAKPLSDADRQKILTDVAAIPLNFSAKTHPPSMPVAILRGTATVGSFAKQFPVLNSAAGQAAFVLRLVDASWRQLIAEVGEGSPTWTGGAHQLRLERHARLFFEIKVGYTRCP